MCQHLQIHLYLGGVTCYFALLQSIVNLCTLNVLPQLRNTLAWGGGGGGIQISLPCLWITLVFIKLRNLNVNMYAKFEEKNETNLEIAQVHRLFINNIQLDRQFCFNSIKITFTKVHARFFSGFLTKVMYKLVSFQQM